MREITFTVTAKVSSNGSCADINNKFCDHLSWYWLDGGTLIRPNGGDPSDGGDPYCTLFNEKLRQEHEKGVPFYIFCCAKCVCPGRKE